MQVQHLCDDRCSGSTKGRSANLKRYMSVLCAFLLCHSLSSQQCHSSEHRFATNIHHCRDVHPSHTCTDVPSLLCCGSMCQMELISMAPDPLTTCTIVAGHHHGTPGWEGDALCCVCGKVSVHIVSFIGPPDQNALTEDPCLKHRPEQ